MSQLFQRVNDTILTPALALLPARMDTPEARVELLAIGGQESGLSDRWQVVDKRNPEIRGPARGLWQFEAGGGVAGVLSHPASKHFAATVCAIRGVAPRTRSVWTWLAEDDLLACCFARLLLLTDPRPLPALGDGAAGWDYYVRNWRPGKPHPSTWSGHYSRALATIGAQ